ncbi:MAG: hypothetical protein B6D64_12865 [Bacteroidetes bacterium 4484_276]|nr:MAG: hypothetical protein B6D64_12865 [Bacteroidetes bacterium 4484_276]OYT12639.1 MAG: hypothetical protein B6I19_09340 [Bacteroidetes bacterium 4572_114]
MLCRGEWKGGRLEQWKGGRLERWKGKTEKWNLWNSGTIVTKRIGDTFHYSGFPSIPVCTTF